MGIFCDLPYELIVAPFIYSISAIKMLLNKEKSEDDMRKFVLEVAALGVVLSFSIIVWILPIPRTLNFVLRIAAFLTAFTTLIVLRRRIGKR